MREEKCVGCRYHTSDEMCTKYPDVQTDNYAYQNLCYGRDYAPRKKKDKTKPCPKSGEDPKCGEKVKPKYDGDCANCPVADECETVYREAVKDKPTCPVCGNAVDEPISSEDLEDAHHDRFFEDAIRSEEAEEKEVVPKCEKTINSYGTVYACVLAKDHDGFHRYSREDLNERD